MNVKQLRESLADLPEELIVVVRGYEAGVDEVTTVERCHVVLNVHDEWYYGAHTRVDDDDDVPAGKTVIGAVQVGG